MSIFAMAAGREQFLQGGEQNSFYCKWMLCVDHVAQIVWIYYDWFSYEYIKWRHVSIRFSSI